MLPNDGRIRVVDFGLSHAAKPDGSPEVIAGTPDWMSPEQWRGTARTDRVERQHQGMANEHADDIASLASTDTHQANRTWRSPLDRLTRLFLNQRQSQ